jgi:hypothetical protein
VNDSDETMNTEEGGCDLSNCDDGSMRSNDPEGDKPLQIRMREL